MLLLLLLFFVSFFCFLVVVVVFMLETTEGCFFQRVRLYTWNVNSHNLSAPHESVIMTNCVQKSICDSPISKGNYLYKFSNYLNCISVFHWDADISKKVFTEKLNSFTHFSQFFYLQRKTGLKWLLSLF